MCMTSEAARLSKTIIYAGEAMRNDKLVHVLGYQNTAENLSNEPNAMLLPFPAVTRMGPENIIDTSACKNVLEDLAKAIEPRGRSKSATNALNSRSLDSIQIFNSSQYTIVLATDAKDIPSAMDGVRPDRRPKLNQELFNSISTLYPNWPVALCCWNTREMVRADPMVWWYEPMNPEELFAPGLDAHDGGPPKLGVRAPVDHTVVIGSTINPMGASYFNDNYPEEIRSLIAPKVAGAKFGTVFFPIKLKNGDFIIKKAHAFKPNKILIQDQITRRSPFK